jgi:hypothetical protein
MTAHLDKTIEEFRLGKAYVQQHTSTGTETLYFPLRPGYHTTIMINKTGSTGTLKMSNDFDQVSGVTDTLENLTYGQTQVSGTDDYHKGHTAGFTACEIDITAYVADVEIVITQFLLGD